MNFQEYLLSKKIDSEAFKASEGELWETWRKEFEMISATGFTAQKLFLINPIRRKYTAKPVEKNTATEPPQQTAAVSPIVQAEKPRSENSPITETQTKVPVKPVVPRPVFKPKPKTQ